MLRRSILLSLIIIGFSSTLVAQWFLGPTLQSRRELMYEGGFAISGGGSSAKGFAYLPGIQARYRKPNSQKFYDFEARYISGVFNRFMIGYNGGRRFRKTRADGGYFRQGITLEFGTGGANQPSAFLIDGTFGFGGFWEDRIGTFDLHQYFVIGMGVVNEFFAMNFALGLGAGYFFKMPDKRKK